MFGDSKHPQGAVLAEIVKANIPVSNGVVHLIDRPLMVVDTTVKQFLMVSVMFFSILYDMIKFFNTLTIKLWENQNFH